MKKIVTVAFLVCLMMVQLSYAEKIPEGTYWQTSVTPEDWGDCPTCNMTVVYETPHIIRWDSNNDTIGYAYYDEEKDMYIGAWEWKKGQGGSYANQVFYAELYYDKNVLTLDTWSKETPKHSATFRSK